LTAGARGAGILACRSDRNVCPTSIDATKIEAECKNGLLTVHLAKVEAARPRRVAVKGE